jgi:hypothetical protein
MRQRLNFWPLPHGQVSLRPVLDIVFASAGRLFQIFQASRHTEFLLNAGGSPESAC